MTKQPMTIDKQALRTVAMLAKELSGISMYSKAIAATNKFHELFAPDVALALLDELEAAEKQLTSWRSLAKQNIEEHEKAVAALDAARQRICELESKLTQSESWSLAAQKYIAELEARTKPAKGEVLVTVSGFTGCGKSAIAGEIEIAMKAIGVPVQWTNGDAEKRMTGADWLTAIEMYKPTVRIVELNVPCAAGIGKGE